MNWTTFFYLLGAAVFVWLALRIIRNRPESFTKENLGKTFSTLGWLTLMIIGVVAVSVYFLKH